MLVLMLEASGFIAAYAPAPIRVAGILAFFLSLWAVNIRIFDHLGVPFRVALALKKGEADFQEVARVSLNMWLLILGCVSSH